MLRRTTFPTQSRITAEKRTRYLMPCHLVTSDSEKAYEKSGSVGMEMTTPCQIGKGEAGNDAFGPSNFPDQHPSDNCCSRNGCTTTMKQRDQNHCVCLARLTSCSEISIRGNRKPYSSVPEKLAEEAAARTLAGRRLDSALICHAVAIDPFSSRKVTSLRTSSPHTPVAMV